MIWRPLAAAFLMACTNHDYVAPVLKIDFVRATITQDPLENQICQLAITLVFESGTEPETIPDLTVEIAIGAFTYFGRLYPPPDFVSALGRQDARVVTLSTDHDVSARNVAPACGTILDVALYEDASEVFHVPVLVVCDPKPTAR